MDRAGRPASRPTCSRRPGAKPLPRLWPRPNSIFTSIPSKAPRLHDWSMNPVSPEPWQMPEFPLARAGQRQLPLHGARPRRKSHDRFITASQSQVDFLMGSASGAIWCNQETEQAYRVAYSFVGLSASVSPWQQQPFFELRCLSVGPGNSLPALRFGTVVLARGRPEPLLGKRQAASQGLPAAARRLPEDSPR